MIQPVTFFGSGLVFHPKQNRVLCRFVDGKYVTDKKEEIDILSKKYQHSEIEEKKDEVVETPRRGRPKNASS